MSQGQYAGMLLASSMTGKRSLLSCAYISEARANCRRLLLHFTTRAFSLAFASAGRSMPARIAMIAITTRSSIKVKARVACGAVLLVRLIFIRAADGESAHFVYGL